MSSASDENPKSSSFVAPVDDVGFGKAAWKEKNAELAALTLALRDLCIGDRW